MVNFSQISGNNGKAWPTSNNFGRNLAKIGQVIFGHVNECLIGRSVAQSSGESETPMFRRKPKRNISLLEVPENKRFHRISRLRDLRDFGRSRCLGKFHTYRGLGVTWRDPSSRHMPTGPMHVQIHVRRPHFTTMSALSGPNSTRFAGRSGPSWAR